MLLEDHWRPDDATSTWDAGTWTYRAYNPERKIWEMQGINTNVGAWQPGLMWTAGDSRLLTEWYGPMLVRFAYFGIQSDKFLWRADATFDRGKTWIGTTGRWKCTASRGETLRLWAARFPPEFQRSGGHLSKSLGCTPAGQL